MLAGDDERAHVSPLHRIDAMTKPSPWVAMFAALIVCYMAAGCPAIGLLFEPSVIGEGLALKPLTYHWLNRFDRTTPAPELLASRFYVWVLAGVSAGAALCVLRNGRDSKTFLFALSWSIALLAIFVFAQTQAFYTLG